jgi:hypothetical protein
MNFTTDLPKKNPVCTYLVAGAAYEKVQLRMHVVALAKGIITYFHLYFLEYSTKYREPDVLKHLRFDCDKAKLLDEDMNNDSERILLCHITKVSVTNVPTSRSQKRRHLNYNPAPSNNNPILRKVKRGKAPKRRFSKKPLYSASSSDSEEPVLESDSLEEEKQSLGDSSIKPQDLISIKDSSLIGGLGKGKDYDVVQRLKIEYEQKYHYSLGNHNVSIPLESNKVRTRR